MKKNFEIKQYTWALFIGHLTIEKLLISKEIMESIEKYIERISQYYKIEAIILFGSYAKGTENEDTDIDIAVISSDFKNIIQDGADLIGYTWKIDTRIEPHPIRTQDY